MLNDAETASPATRGVVARAEIDVQRRLLPAVGVAQPLRSKPRGLIAIGPPRVNRSSGECRFEKIAAPHSSNSGT